MSIFNERRAIELEIQNLKEQTRLDYELYLESRKVRNEQVSVLLDRLRELDIRDAQNQSNQVVVNRGTTPNTVKEWESNKRIRLSKVKRGIGNSGIIVPSEDFKLKNFEPDSTLSDNIRKEIVTNGSKKTRADAIPIERLTPLITDFISESKREVRLAEIKDYVEKEVGRSWNNFSEVLRTVMSKSDKIVRGNKRGYYTILEKTED